MTNRTPDLASLTGLRGVAALTVVVYHYLQAPTVLAGNIVSPYAGYLGVDLFFILSGFLMALNYGASFHGGFDKAAYFNFLGKRLARVYPLYAAVTLVVLVLSFWNVFQAHVGYKVVLVNLVLAQQLGPGWIRPYLGDSILGGAWSISTELGAYLLFPLLYWAACRRGKVGTSVALVAGFAVVLGLALLPPHWKVQQLPTQGPLDVWSGWSAWPLLRCLAEFTIGLCMWQIASTTTGSSVSGDGPGFALAASILIALFVPNADFVAVVLIAIFIWHLSCQRSRMSRWLATRPMLWLGEVSYAMYVMHVSLIDMTYEHPVSIFRRAGFHDRYPLVLVVTFTLLFVSSRLLFLFVERPARRWMRSLVSMSDRSARRPVVGAFQDR